MERFAELAAFGIAASQVATLEAEFGRDLLPLQRRVLAETEMLSRGESVLISAPTAAGKTLPAELAALRAINAGRMALYLVPTRALAEQKAREFAARYGGCGVTVACSTGDRRDDDEAILRGRRHLVVAVYEKAQALIARSPSMLDRCGAIVADEVQIIGDPQRGSCIDFLLTRWRAACAPRPQLVALSAVLGNPGEIADWLGLRVVRSEQRPVPLREGVLNLRTGSFRWREVAGTNAGSEDLVAEDSPYLEALLAVAERAGPLIVFCPTRSSANRLAFDVAEPKRNAGNGAACRALSQLPADRSRERLEELLPRRVGLHTADMPPTHRALVEAAFEQGDIDVLVATPTLEQGVNLSAATVVQSPMMIGRGSFGGDGALVPVSRARFLNQGGRAGRSGDGIGRTMVMAEDDAEAERAWRSAILPPPEDVRSPMAERALESHVAHLVCSGAATTTSLLTQWFMRTFGARSAKETMTRRLGESLEEGVRRELWRVDRGIVRLSALGEVVARTNLRADTAEEWSRLLSGCAEPSNRAACLLVVMLAPEWDDMPMAMTREERRHAGWPLGLAERIGTRDELARRLTERLRPAGGPPVSHHRAARRTLVMDEWLEGWSVGELEVRHEIATGRMTRIAAQAVWLALAAAEVAGAVWATALSDRFADLAEELAELGRTPAAETKRNEPGGETRHRLAFPSLDTGHVEFDGRRVELTPNQYRFLACLARRAGTTVHYRTIHEEVWPDAAVEQQQIPYYRREVQKRLLAKGDAPVIRTSQGWGLTLVLKPEEIDLPADFEAMTA